MATDPQTEQVASTIMEILEALLDAHQYGDLAQAAHLARLAAEIGYPLWQVDHTGANSAWLGALSQQFCLLNEALQNAEAAATLETQVDIIHAHLQATHRFSA